MAAVSNRYVDALLEIGDTKAKEKYLSDLKKLSELYQNEEFKLMMDNPQITNIQKNEIIREIVPENETFINFIELIIKENRFSLIADIYSKYKEALDKILNKITIKIISASKLDDVKAKEIAEKFKTMTSASKVDYEIVQDKSLIGGVKVICDGKVYDSTVKRKLTEILN